ncbi:YdiY family protein [Oxalobacteraceae bacterium A2-2]
MKSLTMLAAALALAHPAVHADSIEPTNAHGWNTSAELGAITTSGNTVGTSVTGKIDAKQELPDWSNEYILAGYFKDEEVTLDDGEKTRERSAQRYSASAKAAFKLLQPGDKLFGLVTHVDDRFGAYTRYSTVGVGYGTQWYKTDTRSLDVELGPGYFHGARPAGEIESGMTIRGAANLKWKLSDSALFTQNVSVERGTSNIHSLAETAVRTKINSTMQMKAAFSARNDTNVPADKKNTDTQTSVTLVYSF